MIAMQLFEGLKIMNCFEIKSDRISAECGLRWAVCKTKLAQPYSRSNNTNGRCGNPAITCSNCHAALLTVV